jgi:hypothetical protein
MLLHPTHGLLLQLQVVQTCNHSHDQTYKLVVPISAIDRPHYFKIFHTLVHILDDHSMAANTLVKLFLLLCHALRLVTLEWYIDKLVTLVSFIANRLVCVWMIVIIKFFFSFFNLFFFNIFIVIVFFRRFF